MAKEMEINEVYISNLAFHISGMDRNFHKKIKEILNVNYVC